MIEATEPIAYGFLGLKPEELLDLQPQEFYKMCDGRKAYKEAETLRMAYFVQWLISPHYGKKTPSVEKIAEPFIEKKKKTAAELKAEKDRYMKMLEE